MDVKEMTATPLPLANTHLPASLSGLRPEGTASVKVKKVAQEFEAMFVGMMLKSMRDTVGKDKLTGGGHGEETFRSMLDQEYATAAAQSGGIGLAKMMEKGLMQTSATVAPSVNGGLP
jgi:flagellar protein FlgJ